MGETSLWIHFTLESTISRLIAIFYSMLIIAVVLRVVMRRREIGFSLAWLALIMGIPLAGVILYGLFGELKLGARRAEQSRLMYRPYKLWLKSNTHHRDIEVASLAAPIANLVRFRTGMPFQSGNQLQLITSTQRIIFQLLQDIHAAKRECLLEFYIWHNGGLVEQVNQALLAACSRGVDCRILLDSVGSREFLRSPWAENLRQAGVQIVEVLPVGTFRMLFQRQDLRMHRKLVVIDQQIGYTGSMNMVDPRYFKQDAGVGQWVDVMTRLQGPTIDSMWTTFIWDWEMETGERLLTAAPQMTLPITAYSDCLVQLIPSGPRFSDDMIPQILLQAIYSARHSICLTTPYFVPEESLAAALKSVSQRGVQVDIILPEQNDSRMVKYASRVFIEELVSAGVAIHQFQGGLLHTKSVLIDEKMVLIGTVNLDKRSFWLNFEVTLLVDDPVFAVQLVALQKSYREQSIAIILNRWRKRPFKERILENLFYLLSPLL
ncbi:cardiolipin synthase [Celerinatantimonas yamalensis]|uniref:Cardiolipin synthase A n=1 Tax=Celerinatantimonas yamalensis TaxID=559956 RepID=A0ABW9G1Y6_9GAMM